MLSPENSRFPGGAPLQPHPQEVTRDDQVEVVGFNPPLDQGGESDSEYEDQISLEHDEEADDYIPPNNSPVFMDVSTPDDNQEPTNDLWNLELQHTAPTNEHTEPNNSHMLYMDVETASGLLTQEQIEKPDTRPSRSERIRTQKAMYVGPTGNKAIDKKIEEYCNMVKWDPDTELQRNGKSMWQVIQQESSTMEKQIASNSEVKKASEMSIEDAIMMTPLDDIKWDTLDGDLFQPEPEH